MGRSYRTSKKSATRSKPPLGPPHDAYAAFWAAIALAIFLFFVGRLQVEGDWLGWTGFGVTVCGLYLAGYYFQRAYGFSNKGWHELPRGAIASLLMCAVFGIQFIPSALYAQYFSESIFGLSLIYLTLAVLIVAPIRVTLGKAQTPPAEPKLAN